MQFDSDTERLVKLAGDHFGRRLAMLVKALVVDCKEFVPEEVGAVGNGFTDLYRALCGLDPHTEPLED